MAEKEKPAAAAPAPAEAAAAAPRKKLPLKTVIVVAAVLAIEGVAISGAFMLAGRPADVKAEGAAKDAVAAAEEKVEIQLVQDKYQNTRTGRTYIYDTELYILVRKKDQDKVQGKLDEMSAQIGSDIALIFRRAEPAYLLEPSLATLTRQIKASLDARLGMDAEGGSLVQEVVVKKFTQYRADL